MPLWIQDTTNGSLVVSVAELLSVWIQGNENVRGPTIWAVAGE